MALTLIFGFILGVASLLFIIQNTAIVGLTFMQWHFQAPIAMLVLLAILVGMLLLFLFILPSTIGDAFRMRKLSKHNEALAREAEVQRQAAHDATVRLAEARTPNPDVIDLSQ